jgi:hypothetical protein
MAIRGSYIINVAGNDRLQHIVDTLNTAKEFKIIEPDFLDIRRILRKQDNPVTGVKHTREYRDSLALAYGLDRTFPLETIVCLTADYITQWMEERKLTLDEEDYLKLLVTYK